MEAGKVPVYYGEDDEFPDPRRLDLTELHELRQRVNDEILTIKQSMDDKQKEQEAKRYQEAIDAAVKQRLAEHNNTSSPTDPPVAGQRN